MLTQNALNATVNTPFTKRRLLEWPPSDEIEEKTREIQKVTFSKSFGALNSSRNS